MARGTGEMGRESQRDFWDSAMAQTGKGRGPNMRATALQPLERGDGRPTADCFPTLTAPSLLGVFPPALPHPNPQGGVKDREIWKAEPQVPGKLLSPFLLGIRRLGGEQRSNSAVASATLPRPTRQPLSSHRLKWLKRGLRPAGWS